MSSFLKLSNISKSWGGNRVVVDVNLEMNVDTLGLVGPNGAGKSTLLNIIAGILKADRGEVYLWGDRVTSLPVNKLVRNGVVKTNQIPRPLRALTVQENLQVFSGLRGKADVASILQAVGLYERKDSYPDILPFGYLKRLELAKALACNPTMLLLDEPLGGLSGQEAIEMLQILKNVRNSGAKMLIVEHRLWELFSLVEEVAVLNRGVKIFQGTPEQFRKDPVVAGAYLGVG